MASNSLGAKCRNSCNSGLRTHLDSPKSGHGVIEAIYLWTHGATIQGLQCPEWFDMHWEDLVYIEDHRWLHHIKAEQQFQIHSTFFCDHHYFAHGTILHRTEHVCQDLDHRLMPKVAAAHNPWCRQSNQRLHLEGWRGSDDGMGGTKIHPQRIEKRSKWWVKWHHQEWRDVPNEKWILMT